MPENNTPRLIRLAIAQGVLMVCPWCVLFGCYLLSIMNRVHDDFLVTCIGIGFAQVNLAAACLTLGPFPIKVRLVIGAVVSSFAFFATALSFRGDPPWAFYLGLFIGFISEFVVVQIPLWMIRIRLGWRVIHFSGISAEDSIRSRQFTIRDLFITTTIIAVFLGVARGVILSLPALSTNRTPGADLPRVISIFLLIAGFNLLLAWPAIGAVLLARGQLFTIPLAIGIAVMATYVEVPVFHAVNGHSGPDVYLVFGLLNGPHFVLLLLSLGIMRWFGYRLMCISEATQA